VIRTLLLDVDGVLQFPRPEFVVAIERDYRWRRGYLAFQRELVQDPGEARSLVGDGDLLTVVRRILPRHVRGLSAEAFIERWLAENIELNHDLLDMIPRVNVERIYLATNQEPVRGARIAGLYADRSWLTGILMSHELGYRKPDGAFFDAALARIGRQPGECLFVDDKQAFVAGAVAAGLLSIQFRTNRQLAADLAAYGLLPSQKPPA
jgi:HAD superfamily hydrolase (TIGR01509 family)